MPNGTGATKSVETSAIGTTSAAPAKKTTKKTSATKATASKSAAKKTTTKKTSAKKKAAKKNLVIVESPAKAKTIERFLGKGYRVIASNGHVRDLPKSQLGVDVENEFEPKYITLRGRGDVLQNIRKEAKNANKVYLATDPDREGEAISWHLAHVLNIEEEEPVRIVFNEITPTAVKSALKEPRSVDMDLVNAQQARRILDRLVGYKISPILWGKVRRGLSAGRVQSVAARIVVDREKEIKDFVPEEFWSITAKLLAPSDKKKAFDALYYGQNGKKIPLQNKEEADRILAAVKGKTFVAKSVKRGERKRNPAPPFTTSNLQQEASRKLGFAPKKTMLIAQQLYEGVDINGKGAVGLVSYIRTDSVRISEDALQAVREKIGESYGAPYLPEKPNYYKGRKSAQDAHEAIRPSYVKDYPPETVKGKLSNDQFKLYKLIYERFVASQMTPANYQTMTVTIEAGEEEFRATGSRMLFDGFTRVYTEGKDNVADEDEGNKMLPEIQEGEELKCEELLPEQHFTQPPPRFTEASLVRALEEKGIGRPSTYAPTISTIVDRGYVRRDKRVLYPTELGELVTDLMKENFSNIVDETFTAKMEENLDGIENHEETWQQVLQDFYGPFEKTLETAEKNIEKIQLVDEVSDIECEKCGAMMVYKYGRFGRFLACPNYPECKNTKAIVQAIDTPCPKCGAKILKRKSKKGGRLFYGCERYPDCDFVSWDYPAKDPCPECGGMMVIKQSKKGPELRCTNAECKHTMPLPAEEKEASNGD